MAPKALVPATATTQQTALSAAGAGAGRGRGGLVTLHGPGQALTDKPLVTVVSSHDGRQELMHVSASAQDHVAAYLEYHRIVGDADGGTPFTPQEYADFKARVLPARAANRLFVHWREHATSRHIDCKAVGPQSLCFCGHRYTGHATDAPTLDASGRGAHRVPCRQSGCACPCFRYVPVRGVAELRCSVCKHGFERHRPFGAYTCNHAKCPCSGFRSSYACPCGSPFNAHTTVFETKSERQAAGRSTTDLGGAGAGDVYAGAGGVTTFASLADGIQRLALSDAELAQLQGEQTQYRMLTGPAGGASGSAAGAGAVATGQRKPVVGSGRGRAPNTTTAVTTPSLAAAGAGAGAGTGTGAGPARRASAHAPAPAPTASASPSASASASPSAPASAAAAASGAAGGDASDDDYDDDAPPMLAAPAAFAAGAGRGTPARARGGAAAGTGAGAAARSGARAGAAGPKPTQKDAVSRDIAAYADRRRAAMAKAADDKARRAAKQRADGLAFMERKPERKPAN